MRAKRRTLHPWLAIVIALIHQVSAIESDTALTVQNSFLLETEPGRPLVSARLPDSLVLKWVPPRRQSGAQIKKIEVSMLHVDDPSATWVDATPHTPGVGIVTLAQPQVQTLTSRADLGQTVNDGTFRLSLETSGHHDIRTESRKVTELLTFDSTAVQVKDALQSLAAITSASVTRGKSDAQGGYTWTITFLEMSPATLLTAGPLLVVLEPTSTAIWTGPGDQLRVLRRVAAGTSSTLSFCTQICEQEIEGLLPGLTYSFRVREVYQGLHGTLAYGPFSSSSAPDRVTNLPQAKLNAPTRVTLSTARATSLTVSFTVYLTQDGEQIQAQYRIRDSMRQSHPTEKSTEWRDVQRVFVDDTVARLAQLRSVVGTATADDLLPYTSYEFRIRTVRFESEDATTTIASVASVTSSSILLVSSALVTDGARELTLSTSTNVIESASQWAYARSNLRTTSAQPETPEPVTIVPHGINTKEVQISWVPTFTIWQLASELEARHPLTPSLLRCAYQLQTRDHTNPLNGWQRARILGAAGSDRVFLSSPKRVMKDAVVTQKVRVTCGDGWLSAGTFRLQYWQDVSSSSSQPSAVVGVASDPRALHTSPVLTSELPFDATANQVANALRAIGALAIERHGQVPAVMRRDLSDDTDVNVSGFEWTISFQHPTQTAPPVGMAIAASAHNQWSFVSSTWPHISMFSETISRDSVETCASRQWTFLSVDEATLDLSASDGSLVNARLAADPNVLRGERSIEIRTRVVCDDSDGTGDSIKSEWSLASAPWRLEETDDDPATMPTPSPSPPSPDGEPTPSPSPSPPPTGGDGSGGIIHGGVGHIPPQTDRPNYIPNAGVGGETIWQTSESTLGTEVIDIENEYDIQQHAKGGDGLVVLTVSRSPNDPFPTRSFFYATSNNNKNQEHPPVQTYIVPWFPVDMQNDQGRINPTSLDDNISHHPDIDSLAQLTLEIEAWGAGGGGGPTPRTRGGAAGYVRTTITVRSGDILEVLVGDGGQGALFGGYGGRDGGHGAFEDEDSQALMSDVGLRVAGGGGGASIIRVPAHEATAGLQATVAVAGGGGGGGVASEGQPACTVQVQADAVLPYVESRIVGGSGVLNSGAGGGGGGMPVSGLAGKEEVSYSWVDEVSGEEWIGLDGGGGHGGACIATSSSSSPSSSSSLSVPIRALHVSDTSVTLSWHVEISNTWTVGNSGVLSLEEPVTVQVIEMALGADGLAFKAAGTRVNVNAESSTPFSSIGVASLTISDLYPKTDYSFRLRTFTQNSAVGVLGPTLPLSTRAPPANTWKWLSTWNLAELQDDRELSDVNDDTTRCDATTMNTVHSRMPRARWGHSAAVLQDTVFLFGGVFGSDAMSPFGQRGDDETTQAVNISCGVDSSDMDSETSEVLALDLQSMSWTAHHKLENSVWPVGRRDHSSTVLHGEMMMFGGHTSSDFGLAADVEQVMGQPPILGDLWVLDPDPSRELSVDLGAVGVRDDTWTDVAVLVGASEGAQDMCVADVDVEVTIPADSVECASQLQIAISRRSADTDALESEIKVLVAHGNANGQAFFEDGVNNVTVECKPLFQHTLFDQESETDLDLNQWHLDSGGSSTSTGRAKSFEHLSALYDVSASGIWRVHALDMFQDGSGMGEIEVVLHFVLKPCIKTPRWHPINTATSDGQGDLLPNPPARFGHQAVEADGHLFVFGGIGVNGPLRDLWRFSYVGNDPTLRSGYWTELQVAPASTSREPLWGSSGAGAGSAGGNKLLPSRWGMLMAGGYDANSRRFDNGVLHLDLLLDRWSRVPSDTLQMSTVVPASRTNAAVVLVGDDTRLLVFGGRDGAKTFGDVWELSLKDVSFAQGPLQEKLGDLEDVTPWRNICGAHMRNGSGSVWDGTCGRAGYTADSAALRCSPARVLTRAWCERWGLLVSTQ